MPWMGVGVYLPPPAAATRSAGRSVVRSAARTGFSAFGDLVDVFAALLRAAGFFAAARFFMPRTLQPARSAVNAPVDATVRQ
jgi:hypothetical protein